MITRRRKHPGNAASLQLARKAWQAQRKAANESHGEIVVDVTPPPLPLPEKLDPKDLPDDLRFIARHKPPGRPRGVPPVDGVRPDCPQCGASERVKRAGFVYHASEERVQRWKCGACRVSFNGPGYRRKDRRKFNMICYRCGREHCKRFGVVNNGAGMTGYCPSCKRRFTQGGREDLVKYHLVLEKRVAELALAEAVKVELLQYAYQDVLEGFGYCWNVPLRVRDAKRAHFGEWREAGDHPVYRMHDGRHEFE